MVLIKFREGLTFAGGAFHKKGAIMIQQAIDILSMLGILPVISMVAVAVGAIYIYRYFTDKG